MVVAQLVQSGCQKFNVPIIPGFSLIIITFKVRLETAINHTQRDKMIKIPR